MVRITLPIRRQPKQKFSLSLLRWESLKVEQQFAWAVIKSSFISEIKNVFIAAERNRGTVSML